MANLGYLVLVSFLSLKQHLRPLGYCAPWYDFFPDMKVVHELVHLLRDSVKVVPIRSPKRLSGTLDFYLSVPFGSYERFQAAQVTLELKT